MIIVKLSSAEITVCAHVAILQRVACLQGGMEDKHGFDGDSWGIQIEGNCGEYAFCKSRNITWVPKIGTFKRESDVGKTWEVRTRSRDDYELIIRPDDIETRNFILVTGTAPTFTIRGWYNGKGAKREEWKKTHGDRPAAWFVPTKFLKSIAELKDE